jgi:hypothetical protein
MSELADTLEHCLSDDADQEKMAKETLRGLVDFYLREHKKLLIVRQGGFRFGISGDRKSSSVATCS